MLTKLRIQGFKNLKDVELNFGFFTCIAGPNGVGKSNLFDAILFLSDLATMPIIKAASKARGTNGRLSDFKTLFFRDRHGMADAIVFEAQMIVPRSVVDDFDQEVSPTATLLEYSLELRLNQSLEESIGLRDPIYIAREELKARNSSDADKVLKFKRSKKFDRTFIFGPGNRRQPFISTKESDQGTVIINLHGDNQKDGRGNPAQFPARKSPQAVLSGVNTSSHPTVLAARREMQSWRLMQLEPSALRKPDEFGGEANVSSIGEHLPNTLARLQNNVEVANRLSELIPEVVSVDVDADSVRQLRTLVVTMRDTQRYSAGSLSDGTLRFLALAVLASDPKATGLVCMEEPENGIHPLRIPEMLKLVRSLSDAESLEDDFKDFSALRQVIINTHSPLIVARLPVDELLMAETLRFKGASFVNFKALNQSWRDTTVEKQGPSITRGELYTYLTGRHQRPASAEKKTVRDRLDEQPDLFGSPN